MSHIREAHRWCRDGVRNPRYVSGEVLVDAERTLYISRGVGHLIRARFNVRPEITLFTLRSAARA